MHIWEIVIYNIQGDNTLYWELDNRGSLQLELPMCTVHVLNQMDTAISEKSQNLNSK